MYKRQNHCNLTINDFGGGRRFISGNRCERPLGGTKKADLPNLYKWKLEKLKSYGEPSGIANPIAKIGLPFGLNNFELLPFWTAFLRKLGFETVLSDVSTRDMYCLLYTSQHSAGKKHTECFLHGEIFSFVSPESAYPIGCLGLCFTLYYHFRISAHFFCAENTISDNLLIIF